VSDTGNKPISIDRVESKLRDWIKMCRTLADQLEAKDAPATHNIRACDFRSRAQEVEDILNGVT